MCPGMFLCCLFSSTWISLAKSDMSVLMQAVTGDRVATCEELP
jgi:hypothetical protein